jgi:hypothetical protein
MWTQLGHHACSISARENLSRQLKASGHAVCPKLSKASRAEAQFAE